MVVNKVDLSDIASGTQIYKYVLHRELGKGQSSVYLATDITTEKQVALKLLDSSNKQVANLLYEAQTGARFCHKNLAEILYADVAEFRGADIVLIAQRYYANGACSNLLTGPSVLSAKIVQKLLIDVLIGLEYLHGKGFYHNDIKPGNILIGDHQEFLLTDFGIAWSPASGLGSPGLYTPHVPPESIVLDGESE